MRRVTTLVAVAATAALALAACSSSSSGSTSTSPSAGASSAASSSAPAGGAATKVKVGLAYDVGGRGDQSFNDSAATGLDKAKAEFKGLEVKELEATQGETDAQKEERLRLLADGGYNPVIGVGFAYATALKKVAAEFPDIKFAIIDDDSIKAPNVTPLVFAEQEGSFLVGVIAAQASKSGSIGYIGGVNTPLLKKFEAGYTAGAKAVNPAIKVQAKYLTEPRTSPAAATRPRARPWPRACSTPVRTSSTPPRAVPAAAPSKPSRPRRSWPSGSTPTST